MNAIVRGEGRPSKGYRDSAGKRVPGVTTVIGRFKDSGGLIHWAWSQGIEGIDYRQTRDSAADTGTYGHALIEAYLYGEEWSFPDDATEEQRQGALGALEAFKRWARSVEMVLTATEVPLVCDEYRFGGTVDAVGHVAGELVIVDWKTSNSVYSDYIVQVSAYAHLWETQRGERIHGAHLLRVGKEHGQFAHHSWPRPVLDKGWAAFRLMRELYEYDKTLKKAV